MSQNKMLAGLYMGPENLELEYIECPKPKTGEALIKVEYVGICGSDMLVYKGAHPRCSAGTIMCHELIGKVQALGPGNDSEIKVNDNVVVNPITSCGCCLACQSGFENVCENLIIKGISEHGALAEYVVASVKRLHKFSEKIDPHQAALLEPLAVAVHDVRCSRLKAGSNVLVLGGGPIGHLIALVCRAAGASAIIVSEVNPFRLSLLREAGLNAVNPTKVNLQEYIKQETRGSGIDVTFEVAGVGDSLKQATTLTNIKGQIVVVAMPKNPVPIDLMAIAFKEYEIIGCRTYLSRDFKVAIDLLEKRRISVKNLVSHIVSLKEAKRGFELLVNGGEVMKVLIQP